MRRRVLSMRLAPPLFALAMALIVFESSVQALPVDVPTRSRAGFKVNTARGRFDHGLLDGLLSRHVKNGRVDYLGLRRERRVLDHYLFRLAKQDLTTMGNRNARFAFWINAYNAITLRAVLDRLPAERSAWKRFSVTRVKGFWKAYRYQVARRWLTLDQIEHQVLRPTFKDPRLHFAIVCASIGCPSLRSNAYQPEDISLQLSEATKRFLASSRGYRLDRTQKRLSLSRLFKWFAADFLARPYGSLVEFLASHRKKDAAFLRSNRPGLQIQYLPYDWDLNVR